MFGEADFAEDLPNALETLSSRKVRIVTREEHLARCNIGRVVLLQKPEVREGQKRLRAR